MSAKEQRPRRVVRGGVSRGQLVLVLPEMTRHGRWLRGLLIHQRGLNSPGGPTVWLYLPDREGPWPTDADIDSELQFRWLVYEGGHRRYITNAPAQAAPGTSPAPAPASVRAHQQEDDVNPLKHPQEVEAAAVQATKVEADVTSEATTSDAAAKDVDVHQTVVDPDKDAGDLGSGLLADDDTASSANREPVVTALAGRDDQARQDARGEAREEAWSSVRLVGEDCLVPGHERMKVSGKWVRSANLIFEKFHPEARENWIVRATCLTPQCVRHLIGGTAQDIGSWQGRYWRTRWKKQCELQGRPGEGPHRQGLADIARAPAVKATRSYCHPLGL